LLLIQVQAQYLKVLLQPYYVYLQFRT
jgi:hypothetical protein